MQETRVEYTAPPTLSEFLDSDAFVRGVVGPVGSGKSSACVLEFLRRAMEQEPGPDGIRRSRFAAIRNTYGQLRDTTRKTFEQWIPPQLGRWHEQEFSFEMKFKDVHCEVLFRALDRPEDVKKLLSLELTGAYFNEFREISRNVFEVMQTRIGRFPSKAQGGPTWFGIWFDTNPWHTGHWAHKFFRSRPEGHELYRQPGGRDSTAENVENLPAGYYDRLCIGKDEEWKRVYVDGQEASSDVGSVWGALVTALEGRGGVAPFTDYYRKEVFTNWDLGGAGARGDATAIWWWALNRNGAPDVLDYYEAHGMGLSHYFDVLQERAAEKGFKYAKHWLPHDARAKSLQTGMSTLEQFAARVGIEHVAIAPQLSLADGIQAARWLLERPIRFLSPACDAGLEVLREYRFEWNEANRCFGNTPLHNWASHGSDAFRYLAVVARQTAELMRKPGERVAVPPPEPHKPFTLDGLFEAHERNNRGRGRRI